MEVPLKSTAVIFMKNFCHKVDKKPDVA